MKQTLNSQAGMAWAYRPATRSSALRSLGQEPVHEKTPPVLGTVGPAWPDRTARHEQPVILIF